MLPVMNGTCHGPYPCPARYSTFLALTTWLFKQEHHPHRFVAGEVPNLFPKDELAGVLDEVRPAAKKEGAGETSEALYAFFLEKVRTNLHVILCLSPIGEAFRERCRMFPGKLLLQLRHAHGVITMYQ